MASKALTVKKDELQVSESVTGELETTATTAREVAEVQAAVIMARKFPRDEARAYSRLIASCGRESFAEDATYSFPRGNTTVSGPSVNIAREAARIWGNVRFGLDIIRDDEETRAIRGWAWDVESNTKVSYVDEFAKLIQRKDKDSGQTRWISPDERDLRELTNRRGAICLRNCLLNLIPKDFIEDALGECERTLKGQVKKDKPAAIKAMAEDFANMGVTLEMLEQYLNHPLADVTDSGIVRLKGIYRALTDDFAKKEEYFGTLAKKGTEEGSLKMGDLKPGNEAEHQGHDAPPLTQGTNGHSEGYQFFADGIQAAPNAKELHLLFGKNNDKFQKLPTPEKAEILNMKMAQEDAFKAA